MKNGFNKCCWDNSVSFGKDKLVSVASTAHQDKRHMDHLIKHNKTENCTSYKRKHVDFCII